MSNSKFTKRLTRAGLIAGLYTATSFVIAPLASGAVQIRLSEALTMLALIFPEAIPALFVGCFLSNLITGCAPFDIIFGSLITLIAGSLTFVTGRFIKNLYVKVILGGLFPVILNAVFLPLIWVWCYGVGEYVYILQALLVLVGQLLSVYGLGVPLFLAVKKRFIE